MFFIGVSAMIASAEFAYECAQRDAEYNRLLKELEEPLVTKCLYCGTGAIRNVDFKCQSCGAPLPLVNEK